MAEQAPKWKLTDEEIGEIDWQLGCDAQFLAIPPDTGIIPYVANVVAQAQLEKAEPLIRQDERRRLVEWLEKHHYTEESVSGKPLHRIYLDDEEWQELRRQVGLE